MSAKTICFTGKFEGLGIDYFIKVAGIMGYKIQKSLSCGADLVVYGNDTEPKRSNRKIALAFEMLSANDFLSKYELWLTEEKGNSEYTPKVGEICTVNYPYENGAYKIFHNQNVQVIGVCTDKTIFGINTIVTFKHNVYGLGCLAADALKSTGMAIGLDEPFDEVLPSDLKAKIGSVSDKNEPKESEIVAGDVVVLKSHKSDKMTVSKIEGDMVNCWTILNGKSERVRLPMVTLIKAK